MREGIQTIFKFRCTTFDRKTIDRLDILSNTAFDRMDYIFFPNMVEFVRKQFRVLLVALCVKMSVHLYSIKCRRV